jgi:hypothetical protein
MSQAQIDQPPNRLCPRRLGFRQLAYPPIETLHLASHELDLHRCDRAEKLPLPTGASLSECIHDPENKRAKIIAQALLTKIIRHAIYAGCRLTPTGDREHGKRDEGKGRAQMSTMGLGRAIGMAAMIVGALGLAGPWAGLLALGSAIFMFSMLR